MAVKEGLSGTASGTQWCPQCGKEFVVLYPTQWGYKRGNKYLCSWSCLRAYDKKGGEKLMPHGGKPPVLTQGQKNRAVAMALNGYTPIPYLKKCGAKSPLNQWSIIRRELKDDDPGTWSKLPPTIKGLPEEPEDAEWPEAAEQPEAETDLANEFADEFAEPEAEEPEQKITQPVMFMGKTIVGIKGKFGEYHRGETREGTWIDFESDGGDELSMTVDKWRLFLKDLKESAAILGVEL